MSMEEYATAAKHDHVDARPVDENGRLRVPAMTDREISEETLLLLRGLSDGMSALMRQVEPTIAAMSNGPLGRLLGGNGRG